MKRVDFELLGDKHKKYESLTEQRLMSGCPVVIRLDGRSFHTFTKGMKRPFDERLSKAMIDTTIDLVKQTSADIGYCQSDEISLAFSNTDPDKDFMFGGRIQKIVSVVASIASVKFNRIIQETISERANMQPVFDARVFQYPTLTLAAETFLWRETDATRNSLTMAASSLYTHREMQGAGFVKKHNMLHEKGVNWNDYPVFFKRGTYVGPRKIFKNLTELELSRIKKEFRPTGPIERNVVGELKLPVFTEMLNPVGVFFFGEPYQTKLKE